MIPPWASLAVTCAMCGYHRSCACDVFVIAGLLDEAQRGDVPLVVLPPLNEAPHA